MPRGPRKGKKALPDRWLDYTAIGNQIRGFPIIACKVPLKEEIIRNRIQDEEWFTPAILMDRVKNIGCIVDLTATYRYYDPAVFTSSGIRHEKIFCEGHVVPSAPTVQRFFQVVDEFLHSVQSRDKVLMVHCTHGLNRTGYLVTRYMVERRGVEPQAAIAAFNEARGHNIERQNYLEDIQRRKQLPPVVIELDASEEEQSDSNRRQDQCYDDGGRGRPNRNDQQLPRDQGRMDRETRDQDHRRIGEAVRHGSRPGQLPHGSSSSRRDPGTNWREAPHHGGREPARYDDRRDPPMPYVQDRRNWEARDSHRDQNSRSEQYRAQYIRDFDHRSQRTGNTPPSSQFRRPSGLDSWSGQHVRFGGDDDDSQSYGRPSQDYRRNERRNGDDDNDHIRARSGGNRRGAGPDYRQPRY